MKTLTLILVVFILCGLAEAHHKLNALKSQIDAQRSVCTGGAR